MDSKAGSQTGETTMHRSRVQTDMKKLDQLHERQAERKGTRERIAPKTDSEGAENGSVEPRPLVATPPMARRGE
jgi:hypothetical protein